MSRTFVEPLPTCITGRGKRNSNGYCQVHYQGRAHGEHRVAYAKARGLSMDDLRGHLVRHTCDNQVCVNPDHLLLGNHADNMRDMTERGRQVRGEKSLKAKLTAGEVKTIRSRYEWNSRTNGMTALAKDFGVAQTTICAILHRQSWKHI